MDIYVYLHIKINKEKIYIWLPSSFWSSRLVQTMANYMRVSIAGGKCLGVSGNVLPWSICFLHSYIAPNVVFVRPSRRVCPVMSVPSSPSSSSVRPPRIPSSVISRRIPSSSVRPSRRIPSSPSSSSVRPSVPSSVLLSSSVPCPSVLSSV